MPQTRLTSNNSERTRGSESPSLPGGCKCVAPPLRLVRSVHPKIVAPLHISRELVIDHAHECQPAKKISASGKGISIMAHRMTNGLELHWGHGFLQVNKKLFTVCKVVLEGDT